VAIDQGGDIWQIPFGEKTAVPASGSTLNAWQSVLADDFRFALDFPDTADEAALGGGAIVSATPTKQGARTESLQLYEGGSWRDLGGATFLDPRIVLDGG